MEDLHNRWPHRWLSTKAEPRLSKIQGLGVFAREPILKGEDVAALGGVIVPKNEIGEYWRTSGHVGIQIDDNFFIVPTTRQELEEKGVFNHSCEPNIGFKNSITLTTIRDIKVSEELTFDYAFCESLYEPMICNCGSEGCRKSITPDDWRIKDIQHKYGQYFSPYLKEKF